MDNLITKTFVFEHQTLPKSQNLEISLQADTQLIDIKYIIDIWRNKNQEHRPMTFKIYDAEINRYVPLKIEIPIQQGFLFSPVIMIKYRQKEGNNVEDENGSQVSSKVSEDTKRERNRQRSIREVLEYVKEWREIHNTFDKHNNKINLQDAAKMVGISKKSLDDYYCQLRLAEEYGFNFQQNIEEKIGVLRTYVKERRGKADHGNKHERLPKNLRILEEIGKSSWLRKGSSEEESPWVKKGSNETEGIKMEQQLGETIIEAQYQPPLAIIPQDEYQNRFFNSFNFMLDEPEDPFITLGKRDYFKEQQSESQYSFL